MDIFGKQILEVLQRKDKTFPWVDINFIIQNLQTKADEFILTSISHDLLSTTDQKEFMRLLQTDINFDADDFLYNHVSNYDDRVDEYFIKWLNDFENSL